MKTLTALLALSICACSSVSKETYTETRQFTYPKGVTPHLKHMYMDKTPEEAQVEVRPAEPIIHQEFNHDLTGTGDVLPSAGADVLDMQNENRLLYAMMINKMLKNHQ
jgi:hypothetical protein